MDKDNFLENGELVGEGTYKKAYRLDNKVLLIPKEDSLRFKDDVLSQINTWEKYKAIDTKGILLPLLDYNNSVNDPWYITEYVDTVADLDLPIKLGVSDYEFLNGITVDEITQDTLDDLITDEFEFENNIGIYNGKQIILDYSLTARSCLNTILYELICDCSYDSKQDCDRVVFHNLKDIKKSGIIYMYCSVINQDNIATIHYHLDNGVLLVDKIDCYFEELHCATIECVKLTLDYLVSNSPNIDSYDLDNNKMNLF